MFKKGQRLLVVDDDGVYQIKCGEIYTTSSEQDGEWVEIDLDGEAKPYYAKRFKAVQEDEKPLMFSDDPVGTPVYCLRFGHGKIFKQEKYEGQGHYTVRVLFPNDATRGYTPEGKYVASDENPMLFYEKPEVKAPVRPKFVSNILGKMVVVSTKDGHACMIGEVTGETEEEVEVKNFVYAKASYFFNLLGDKI